MLFAVYSVFLDNSWAKDSKSDQAWYSHFEVLWAKQKWKSKADKIKIKIQHPKCNIEKEEIEKWRIEWAAWETKYKHILEISYQCWICLLDSPGFE